MRRWRRLGSRQYQVCDSASLQGCTHVPNWAWMHASAALWQAGGSRKQSYCFGASRVGSRRRSYRLPCYIGDLMGRSKALEAQEGGMHGWRQQSRVLGI